MTPFDCDVMVFTDVVPGPSQKLALVALALAGALTAQAAQKDVEALLARMRRAYQGVKTARFTTETHIGKTTFINSFVFMAPSKIRVEISAPNEGLPQNTMFKVSDGAVVSTRLPGSSEVTRQEFSINNFERNVPANLESFCFWDYERQLSTAPGKNMAQSSLVIKTGEQWRGKKWTVLEETASAVGVSCRYFIDPRTYLIWRTVVTRLAGDQMPTDSIVTKLETGAKIDESLFKPG